MLVLYESAVGFVLFKVAKLDNPKDAFDTPEGANNLVKLQAIHRFTSTASAVEDMTAVGEGKISKTLKKFLTDEVSGNKKLKKEQLVVSEPKLGGAIAKKLELNVVSDSTTADLYRGIRQQLASLLGDVDPRDLATMELGLSHSLSRYKLKFSPDKVDTMIVQAIALLDDLDKEINIYSMRVKEWYGWHFPEMAKIITENLTYAKVVKAMGFRTNYATTDFSHILPEELEDALKSAAAVSMGTEISDGDLAHIHLLADQVISITQYRTELYEYLRNRMAAIAPNLTALVGELVGARLIAHAGSLISLAKQPASTIQILGAEKALFRALKTKHDTPKYGLIFHSSLVGQAPPKLKGKMARMVATKAALSIRLDALADADSKSSLDSATIGIDNRVKLEARLRQLEAGTGFSSLRQQAKMNGGEKQKAFSMQGNGATYATGADSIPTAPVTLVPTGVEPGQGADEGVVKMEVAETEEEKRKREKREKKERRKSEKLAAAGAGEGEVKADGDVSPKKEKKEKKEKVSVFSLPQALPRRRL
ncbi:nucleolar protein 58 [Rhodotorula sp. JG-1b]|nr:nucleolar protein 58 [Rhodotorula sp. JG-1b]